MQNSLKCIINYSKTVAEQPVNVSDAVSDVKIQNSSGGVTLDFYSADILSAQDYFPFGMLMPGRNFSSNSYRFGHNGQELVNELTGINGSHYTALFWEYDAKLGRRWNMNPVDKPWESLYLSFSGNPIFNIDFNGDNAGWYVDGDGNTLGWDGVNDNNHYLVSDEKDKYLITENDKKGEATKQEYLRTEIKLLPTFNERITFKEYPYEKGNQDQLREFGARSWEGFGWKGNKYDKEEIAYEFYKGTEFVFIGDLLIGSVTIGDLTQRDGVKGSPNWSLGPRWYAHTQL